MKRTWQQAAASVFLVLCSIVYAVRGYHDQTLALQSLDFKTVYGGARCLLHGCDPYDSTQIYKAFLDAGGPGGDMRPFRPHEPIYPPFSLALLTPFALFSWKTADLLWLAVSTGAFLLGTGLIARLCLSIAPLTGALVTGLLIGVLVLTSTTLIMLAQPAQLSIGLCAIAVYCILEARRQWIGVVCFALSLALKPHVTGWIWLYFFLSAGQYRRQAWRVLAVAVVICLPGLLWASLMPASSNWLREIPANVAGITAHGLSGDPGPGNGEAPSIAGLQTVISLFRDVPAFYNKVAEAAGVILLALWCVPALRIPASKQRDYLALAAIACISLLPVYHREYDTRILILIFPACALMLQRAGRGIKAMAFSLTLLTLVLITHNFNNFVMARVLPSLGTMNVWKTIFWLRPVAVWTSLLTLFFLAMLYRELGMGRRRAGS